MSTVKLDYDQCEPVVRDTLLDMYEDALWSEVDTEVLDAIVVLLKYLTPKRDHVLIEAILNKKRTQYEKESQE